MGTDNIDITILSDGTIKVETDRVSMPNHANAEEFINLIATLAGGEQSRERRGHVHAHGHEHHHHHEGAGH